jgi:hypothetical protein
MKQYIVFYTENNKEKSLPITATDQFNAKYIAFKDHEIPLQTISRVL